MRFPLLLAGLLLAAPAFSAPDGAMPRLVSSPSAPALTLDGPAHRGQFLFESRVIPLPPGTWRELERHGRYQGRMGGPGFQDRSVALLRESPGGADALIVVTTTDQDHQLGLPVLWGVPGPCRRDDTYFRQVAALDDRNQDCLLVLHGVARAGNNATEAWKDWVQLAQRHPGALPATLVGAQYRLAGEARAISVAYYFGVEAAGFPRTETRWSESPWQKARLDPQRQAFVARVGAWATANADAVRAGVQRQRAATLPNP